MERIPLTLEGKQRLQEELKKMKSVERPAIVAAIEEARAHGDLKENAEYHAAKDAQGKLEAWISKYEDHLSRSEVVDTQKLPTDRVVFGLCVTVIDEADDQEKTYQIVGELEANIDEGRLSVTSPLAKSLIGKEVGDIAIVRAPGGNRELEIVDIQHASAA
jgi:transcription elongation factor GreA